MDELDVSTEKSYESPILDASNLKNYLLDIFENYI